MTKGTTAHEGLNKLIEYLDDHISKCQDLHCPKVHERSMLDPEERTVTLRLPKVLWVLLSNHENTKFQTLEGALEHAIMIRALLSCYTDAVLAYRNMKGLCEDQFISIEDGPKPPKSIMDLLRGGS